MQPKTAPTPHALPELLAPAGDHDALLAALGAGADAVYLGVEQFNARRNAANFTLEGLRDACDLAHLMGKRVYLTLNTAILPSEFSEAVELAAQSYRAGVDALIVQDLGLLTTIARDIPALELHASTQMNIHSTAAVAYVRQLGAKRVTLSRELGLDEIATLAKAGVELEVFAHGALCFCYSGQCLMSSLIGRRSANRGLCAQPCRLPWNLIDTSTGKRLETNGDYLLSPADLATIDILPQLRATGVTSLKLEGRMKSPHYVSGTTAAYRAALDALDALAPSSPSEPPQTSPHDLAELFSRGFTTAYLEGDRSNTMMSYQRPNNRGVPVGRVAHLTGDLVGIDLSKAIAPGDTLEIWTAHGRCIVTPGTLYASPSDTAASLAVAAANTRAYLHVPQPIGKGDRVFRVRNASLMSEAAAHFDGTQMQSNNGFVPVAATVKLQAGAPLTITFATATHEATATGPLVERARTKALTVDEVCDHVGRVGGTPFSIRSWDIELDNNVGMGFSALHKARAQALDNLRDTVLAPWHARILTPRPARITPAPVPKEAPRIAALVRSLAGAQAAAQAGAQAIYLHTLAFEATAADTPGHPAPRHRPTSPATAPIPVLPAICHDHEIEACLAPVEANRPVLVNNLAQLPLCLERGAHVEAGPSLGIYNLATLEHLAQAGVTRAWLSPELSLASLKQFTPSAPLQLGLTVFGQQELMVSEHCVLMAQGPCDQHCAACARRKAPRLLEDRKGYRFPVRTDDHGRSHIYNAVPLDLIPQLPSLITCGISTFLVDATLLTTKQTAEEVARAVRARDIAQKGSHTLPKREGMTTGHLNRGVL
ncbi:MAG: U32 family peptidase [Coriobacteriales bacterium]|jgi:putative protease|nr:U32 family peptidase [Coriobacteriales bacterium]